jgi:hypothetical protein
MGYELNMFTELFNKHGAVHVPKLVPIEFCKFFTHVLMRQSDLNPRGDLQIPNAKSVLDHEYMFETLQEHLWPTIEVVVGEELIPTYSYARLYSNGDVLEKHTDRPACEVSVTLQLGRSHHYAWPIYMGGNRYDMAEGDSVVYSGCDIEHWRDKCDGPANYYSGQVFCHYVRKNGKYANEVGDSSVRNIFSYAKNRTNMMENK